MNSIFCKDDIWKFPLGDRGGVARSMYTRRGLLISVHVRTKRKGSNFSHFGAYVLNE